jgi:hypothetical protein
MYINEHAVDTKITLNVTIKGEVLEYDSTIKYGTTVGDKHTVLVEPIKTESGKFLDISKCIVTAEIMDDEAGRPYKYRIIANKYVPHNKQFYLMLVAFEDADPINRRDAYRASICEDASIQINGHTSVVNGYTHDLSVTGIGLTLNKDTLGNQRIKEGDTLSITFTVKQLDRFYRVNAEVCRIVDVDDRHILVGCRLVNFSQPIAALVTRLSVMERKTKNIG